MNMFTRFTTAALLAAGLSVGGAAIASADPIDATVGAAVSIGADVAADVNAVANVVLDLDGICIRIGDLVIIGCNDEPDCPEAEVPEVPRTP